jgi:hypothetical protein
MIDKTEGLKPKGSTTVEADKTQTWKESWPQGFEEKKPSACAERGRTEHPLGIGRPRANSSPAPGGGKGAVPSAAKMTDGTTVMRLDDKSTLEQLFTE